MPPILRLAQLCVQAVLARPLKAAPNLKPAEDKVLEWLYQFAGSFQTGSHSCVIPKDTRAPRSAKVSHGIKDREAPS